MGAHGRNLFLHVIEMGCTDVCVIAVSAPLTSRVFIGNSDGWWGPNVSSATDFLNWYERWLGAGRDDRALELTSPQQSFAAPDRHRMAPKIGLSVTPPRNVSQSRFSGPKPRAGSWDL
ncbi:hypothetical protein [Streptomyces sp. SID1328]|uniref:hypothetical protein n=1 Tax=Streptomyces sp. SID1328 TaxID=2690250 RepID=UPI0031F9ECCF